MVIGYTPFELWITPIEGKPNNRDRITKTRNFFQETTQKLRNSKDIDEKDKRSHEEAVWQEKTKLSKTKARRQCMVGDQEYSVEIIFKEAEPKNI